LYSARGCPVLIKPRSSRVHLNKLLVVLLSVMKNYYVEPKKYAIFNAEPRVEAISQYFGLTHIIHYSYSARRGRKAPALIS